MNDYFKRLTPYLCATAIVVVITLTAAQLDAQLLSAAQLFAWSAAFLAARVILDVAHAVGSGPRISWNSASSVLRFICFVVGGTFWLTGAKNILLHFRVDPLQIVFLQTLLVVSIVIASKIAVPL